MAETKKKRKRPTPAWRVPRKCPCGRTFLPLTQKHEYHSSSCRWRAWKVREGRRRPSNDSAHDGATETLPECAKALQGPVPAPEGALA
jgi:hypothetical protein